MANNIITKAKPQLVRRQTQITYPKNVSVVVNQKRAQTTTIKSLKRQIAKPTPAPTPTPTPTPKPVSRPTPVEQPTKRTPISIISRQQLIKQRRKSTKSTVKYITADPVPESAAKIASIKNSGRGKILIIVGNGPSILEAELNELTNHPKIELLTINKPDQRIWPTKYWAFFDHSQFVRHEAFWNGYDGIIFNSTAIKRQKSTSMQFKNVGGKGWSYDLTKGLHVGRSSVFASMQIGMWMGHNHIYIFGCDMNPNGINGNLHFYGQNPDVDPKVRKERFIKEAEFYDVAADLMTKEQRMRFTFCSDYNEHEFVKKYNHMSHKTAVQAIIEHANQL